MNRLLIVLLLLLHLGASAHAETLILTREKSVAMALEQNESFRSALLEKDRIRGQYLEARAGALPRLTFDGSYLRNINPSTNIITMTDTSGQSTQLKLAFGTPHTYSFGLTLTQPLYVGGKVGTAIKIARHGFAYTDASIDAARHDVAIAADKAYLDAIAAVQAEAAYREAENLADSNLAVVQKQYKQGLVSEYDFLRAQVQAANTRPSRIAAANQALLAMDALKNFLALPLETDVLCDTTIAPVPVPGLNLDTLVTEALRNRPELRQAHQMTEIRKDLITIAKGGYKPTLAAYTNVGWQSLVEKFKQTSIQKDAWTRSWSAGLTLSWPIFSGFEVVGKIRQANVDYTQSQLAESQHTRQVRLEVQDELGKVHESGQRVEALGETVSQAERGVEIARVRYRSGVGTQLELLDAQVALTTARVNKISALHDLAIAVASLRRAVGREWSSQW
jgi:outer membrane protein TolC